MDLKTIKFLKSENQKLQDKNNTIRAERDEISVNLNQIINQKNKRLQKLEENSKQQESTSALLHLNTDLDQQVQAKDKEIAQLKLQLAQEKEWKANMQKLILKLQGHEYNHDLDQSSSLQ